jgi:hypothetical protein
MTETNDTPGEAIAGAAAAVPGVGLPSRLNMKRAFDIYVSGRSRSLGPNEKAAVVGGHAETPFPQASAASSNQDPGVRGGKVNVPATLRFDRNAGTWRSLRDTPKGGAR